MRRISQNGINLIKKYEGLRLTAYKCPAHVWTTGYGHTRGVKEGDTCTESQAEAWLLEDLESVEELLNDKLPDLTQDQFDALCSWIFNLGSGNFLTSTLYSVIRKNPLNASIVKPMEPVLNDMGPMSVIKYNFLRWNRAGGNLLKGLVRRRYDEYTLYNSGVIIY